MYVFFDRFSKENKGIAYFIINIILYEIDRVERITSTVEQKISTERDPHKI